MASKISVIIEATADKAVRSLKDFRSSIAEADGAANKMKAGFASASSAIQANAGAIAVGAGTALVAFGVKAVGQFQELALAVGQFSAATGVSTEASSRWIETAGSLGIEAGSVQTALQKMNKGIADGKDVFAKYGVEIARTKDGLVDSNATFQNALTTIGAIKDPTERAKAAQEAFGKSYADVSRLMQMSAGDLKTALADVSDGQVITDKELRSAEKFRDAMDNLRDRSEAFTNSVGGELVPALTDLVEGLNTIADAALSVNETFESWTGNSIIEAFGTSMFGLVGLLGKLTDSSEEATGATDEMMRAQYQLAREMGNAHDATLELESSVDDLKATYDELLGKLSQEDAWDTFLAKMYEFYSSTGRSAAETREYTRDIAEMVMALEGVPAETKAQMIATLDEGNIAAVDSRLNQIARNRVVSIQGQLVGAGLRNQLEGRASGGPVSAGMPYLVGEQGPELVVPRGNGTVIPAAKTAGMLSGTNSSTTVNIYTNADPNSTKAALRLFNRRNGPGL